MRHTLRLLTLALSPIAFGGCAGWVDHLFAPDGAQLHIEALGPAPATLEGTLPYGSYANLPAEQSFFLSDVPLEAILEGGVQEGQFLHCQLIWLPKPGMTPVDPTSTNVVLRYVVVSEGQVGVYGGGGFAWPRGKPGSAPMSLVVRGSSLALVACTEGFVDPLTPARLTGTIFVDLNETTTRQYRRGVSQIVTDAMGESRWVDGTGLPMSVDQVLALVRISDASASSTDAATGSRSGS